ncbi:MAG TPA: metallophosphoesterase [Herpetosiphonaceae bacterium]
MRRVIMQISDLHLGPFFDHERGELIVREAQEIKPELLVIAGDLVMRADFKEQWLLAREYIERMPHPRLIVMGNHDVPQYNQIARYLWPTARYQKYISPILNPVWHCQDTVVVGLNTARSFTIQGGKLSLRQIEWMECTLKSYPDQHCKIVVMHHHVLAPPGDREKQAIVNADLAVAAMDRAGAELVLCGHIHTSFIGNTLEVAANLQAGTIIAQSGTATSTRGRRWMRGKNSFNVIEIEEQVIRISQRMYLGEAKRFVPVSEHVFPRRSAGAYYLPRPERVLETSKEIPTARLETARVVE